MFVIFSFHTHTHTHTLILAHGGKHTLEKKKQTIMSIENGLQMSPAPPTPTPTEATTTTINEEEENLHSSFLDRRATITFIIIFVLTFLYFLHAICCNHYAFC